MRPPLRHILLALVAASATAAAAEKYTDDQRWADEQKADFVISYSPWSNKLNIGIGELRDFDKYPIVVIVDKWDPTSEQQKSVAENLTECFFQAGFRRVLIRQGTGGFGYLALSDATNPKPPQPPAR